jgi:hypothetical protein
MEIFNKRSLFWDVSALDSQKNEQFIIERILEFGDEKDFRWALDFYGNERLKKAILRNKAISRKSLFFWCQFFNLDKTKCLSSQSMLKQSAFLKR